ncbi:MAG: hypothetical protein KJ737_15535 [Proteobacteria bacterium]|nr:hypothetical protein [Pseudomonadota bacterium]
MTERSFKSKEKSLSAFQYTENDSQEREEVTSDLKIYKVPGKHEAMLMAGNVKKLAGILNEMLGQQGVFEQQPITKQRRGF